MQSEKLQQGFSKVLVLIIVLAVIAGGVLAWQYENLFPQKTFSCVEDTDCILAYTGMESCAFCDFSDESFQCVSSEEAERLQQERLEKHGVVYCEPCPPFQTFPIWFGYRNCRGRKPAGYGGRH